MFSIHHSEHINSTTQQPKSSLPNTNYINKQQGIRKIIDKVQDFFDPMSYFALAK